MKTVNFNLHDVVKIQLLNPTAKDVRAVINQIGNPTEEKISSVDITIRFVEKLETGKLNLLALNAGYDEHHFYILRSSKASCKAIIPLEKIGDTCEIICESGMRSVPSLISIISLTFLQKGYMPFHASVFEYKGICSAIMGWAKGGKTEAMLAFAKHGAKYVADEWTIFAPDGSVFGIPEPVRLWDWHIEQLPSLKNEMKTKKKVIFGLIHAVDKFYNAIGGFKKAFPFSILGEALPAIKRQLNARFHPEKIFTNGLVNSGKPEVIFLIGSHAQAETTVEEITSAEIENRMLSSNLFEQFPILEHYRSFRFAFPERQNALLENLAERQKALTESLFANKPCYKVMHPYPLNFEALYQAMAPFAGKSNIQVGNTFAKS